MTLHLYKKNLLPFIKALLSIGLRENLDFLQKKKIKLTNIMALMYCFIILSHYVVASIVKQPELPANILLLVLWPTLSLYLNHKKRYSQSRFLLILGVNLTVILFPLYLKTTYFNIGSENYLSEGSNYLAFYINTYIYGGIACLLPILIFSLKEKKPLILGLLLSFICLHLIEPIDAFFGVSIQKQGFNMSDYIVIMFGISVCFFLLTFSFLSIERILISNEKRYADLLDELNDSYHDLQKIEKEVRRNVSMLEQEIYYRQETEKELYRAKEQAEKASLNKAAFLSTMTHELRTPMNAVIGTAHLLLENNPKADQIEDLQILKFSAENLLSLINDILDFNKIEAGRIEFEQTDFELKKLIKSILHSMTYKAKEQNIELKLTNDSHIPPFIVGDPVRLSQVLNNLVSNAVKFTKKGYVEVATEKVRQQDHTIWIKFKVKDTGIGIPKEKTALIFESYSQANSDTTRKFGGTGLGLAITKKLLELQNSTIHLNSEEGRGSEFFFTLKFKISSRPAHYMPMAESVPGDKDALNNLRILVAEDNHLNQVIIKKFFAKWGVKADLVNNGKQAVEQVQNRTYDIVLMDLEMPVMSGYEASRIITQQIPDLPILAFSAYTKEESQQRIRGTGMKDCISKPLRPKDLFEMLLKYVKPVNEAN